MATRRYSIGFGSGLGSDDVTEAVGAATVTKEIELTVDFGVVTATVGGKALVLLALDKLENYIVKGNWPPA